MTGLVQSLARGQIPGSGTNDNASAGNVGEYIAVSESAVSSTVTITIAAPGVVTWTAHGLILGNSVQFTTTGALPTGLTASTQYWVIPIDANTFKLATTVANAIAGTAITTTGSQSGTHTGISSIPITTATATDIVFIQLTPGDWDVWGNVAVGADSGTLITQIVVWNGTASATNPATPNNGAKSVLSLPFTASTAQAVQTGMQRITVAAGATTTVYLGVRAVFTVSTASAYGFLGARRAR